MSQIHFGIYKRNGGADRFDRHRALYSVSQKSKKWWLRIFYSILDAAAVNAFNLYAAVHPDPSPRLLQFRVQLFRGLVRGFCSWQRRSSLQGMTFMMGVLEDIQLQPSNHFPEKTDSYHRCRLCSSCKNNKRSRIMCAQCKVWLCVNPLLASTATTCTSIAVDYVD